MKSLTVENSLICKEATAAGLVVRYDTIEYRNQKVLILSDPAGNQRFAQWDGKLVDLGLNNPRYKKDICKFIDRQLDFITDFRDYPNFAGAQLEYFNNGGFRDIRLTYKGRILKVFLLISDSASDISWLTKESISILLKSGLLEEF